MISYFVSIEDYQTKNDRVFYCIKIGCNSSSITIFKPYSDLRILNDQVHEKNKEFKLQIKIPEFPKRKLFGRTKNSVEDIKNRAKELQQYLQIILNLQPLRSFAFIIELLPKDCRGTSLINNRISAEYSKKNCWPEMNQLKQSYLERHDRINSSSTKKKAKSDCQDVRNSYQRYFFQMDHYILEEDYVIYYLTMTDMKKRTQYQFSIRYSKLKEYHKLLKKRHFKNALPQFPKSKFIGQTNCDPQLIEERQQLLQRYLNVLFSIKEFVDSEPIIYFLTRIKLEGVPNVYDSANQNNQTSIIPNLSGSKVFISNFDPSSCN